MPFGNFPKRRAEGHSIHSTPVSSIILQTNRTKFYVTIFDDLFLLFSFYKGLNNYLSDFLEVELQIGNVNFSSKGCHLSIDWIWALLFPVDF